MARTRKKNRIEDAVVEQALTIHLPQDVHEQVQQLEQQRALLELRLRTGEEMIAAARSRGEDVLNWESHWIALLNDYEQVSLDIESLLENGQISEDTRLQTSAA